MINAEVEPAGLDPVYLPNGTIEIRVPDVIDLDGAKVVGARDIREGEDVHPCSSRDGSSFLMLELVTGDTYETYCPFLYLAMDPAVKARLDAAPAPAAKDLHTLIMSHINATPRTLSVANAKQVLAHFLVARAQDLTHEQAVEGKAMVEKMVKAAAAASE